MYYHNTNSVDTFIEKPSEAYNEATAIITEFLYDGSSKAFGLSGLLSGFITTYKQALSKDELFVLYSIIGARLNTLLNSREGRNKTSKTKEPLNSIAEEAFKCYLEADSFKGVTENSIRALLISFRHNLKDGESEKLAGVLQLDTDLFKSLKELYAMLRTEIKSTEGVIDKSKSILE